MEQRVKHDLPQWAIGVVIPAQDEERTISACVDSILTAWRMSNRCAPVWIVVVADSCTDSTVKLARAHIGKHGEVVECAARSPGTARRLGAAAVFRKFRTIDPNRVWIANTDADTMVPANWLDVHLDEADDDASAVAGVVDLAADGLRADVSEMYRGIYAIDADGSHGHVHGANLGVRGDAYLDCGGWSDATVSEDHCLWRRLRDKGWKLRSTAASVVMTSARLHGRATGGFADRLRTELAKVSAISLDG